MNEKIKFEKGSGNIFQDLELPDAGDLFLKAKQCRTTAGVFEAIEPRC